jgi:predicted alpha/beta-hydrolase family hydrolase
VRSPRRLREAREAILWLIEKNTKRDMDCVTKPLTLHVSDTIGEVDALLRCPEDAGWLLVLAHGAGAGMDHAFMEELARELSKCRVATYRYQFPYMQQRRKRPDSPAILTATVRAAVLAGSESASGLPVLAGGKSLGGRMTSLAFADGDAPATAGMARVRGLAFFGFPLHPAGRPGRERAEHMARVRLPMLFLQGTRDALADLLLLRPLCDTLGPLATLHVVDGADHSFHVPKRTGRTDSEVIRELASKVASWADCLV